MSDLLDAAESVLEELVTDVETVGTKEVKDEWPDLMTTYAKAKNVLERIRQDQKAEGG